jgi:hypothetical protein
MNLTNIDEESDCESVNGEAFANDTKRLEEGIELFKIFKRRNHYSTRTYKLDLVLHRLVASTKDWRCLKEGAKFCKKKFIFKCYFSNSIILIITLS